MLGSWKTPDKKTEIQKREELLKNSIQNPNYKVQLASGEGKRRILLGVCRKATLMPSVTLKKNPEGWNGEGGGRRVQDGDHM